MSEHGRWIASGALALMVMGCGNGGREARCITVATTVTVTP